MNPFPYGYGKTLTCSRFPDPILNLDLDEKGVKQMKKVGRDDLTEDLAVAMFREMWSELARTGGRKEDCKIVKEYNGDMLSSCTLCEWVKKKIGNSRPEHCKKHCPIEWNKGTCHSGATEFSNWGKADIDTEERRRCAAIIATLPRKQTQDKSEPSNLIRMCDMVKGSFAVVEDNKRNIYNDIIVIRPVYTNKVVILTGDNPGNSWDDTCNLLVRPTTVSICELKDGKEEVA